MSETYDNDFVDDESLEDYECDELPEDIIDDDKTCEHKDS
jgi:hypothetical protein